MKNKIISMLLIGGMAAGAVACGRSGNGNPDAGSVSETQTAPETAGETVTQEETVYESLQEEEPEVYVYIMDGGDGDGSSAQSPLGDLTEAVLKLKETGGAVVLCGDVSIEENTVIPSVDGPLLLMGDGGRLVLHSQLAFENGGKGETITIEDLTIENASAAPEEIICNYNHMRFGDRLTVEADGYYPIIYEGIYSPADEPLSPEEVSYEGDAAVYIGSGTWESYIGGNYRDGTTSTFGIHRGNMKLEIAGGVFKGDDAASSSAAYTPGTRNQNFYSTSFVGMNFYDGNVDVKISGGSFEGPVFGVARFGIAIGKTLFSEYVRRGNMNVEITGGSFTGGEITAMQPSTTAAGLWRGNYDLTIAEGVELADGIILSAECVEPYEGETALASLQIPSGADVVLRAFDRVNGEEADGTEPVRIGFIGDSITFGSTTSPVNMKSYPAQLLARLEAEGKDYIVGNFGVASGGVMDTCTYAYADTLYSHISLEEFDPDIMICALGANDARVAGGTKGRLDRYYNEFKAMVRSYGELPSVKDVYITTAIHRHSAYAAGMNPDTAKQARTNDLRSTSYVMPTQKRIAAELAAESPAANYTLIDLYALTLKDAIIDGYYSSDNLHPNEKGLKIMADCFYGALFEGKCGTDAEFTDSYFLDEIYVKEGAPIDGAGTKEDPMGHLGLALSRVSRSGGRIILLDDYTIDFDFDTPIDVEGGLYIGGEEGKTPTVTFTGKTFKVGSSLVLDNMVFSTKGGQKTPYFVARYQDLTIGKNFSTEKDDENNYPYIVAGHHAYPDGEEYPEETNQDTAQGVSSDGDINIRILGGKFHRFLGGNLRIGTSSPLGTFSGNLSIEVSDASFTDTFVATGMNYTTGSVTARLTNVSAEEVLGTSRAGKTEGFNSFDDANNAGGRVEVFCMGTSDYAVSEHESVSGQTQSADVTIHTE